MTQKQLLSIFIISSLALAALCAGQSSSPDGQPQVDQQSIYNSTKTFLNIGAKSLQLIPQYMKFVVVLVHKEKELNDKVQQQFEDLVRQNKIENIIFTHISLDENPIINKTFQVTQPLTLCMYVKQKLYYFGGDITINENIAKWIEDLTTITLTHLKKNELESFFFRPDVKVVFFLKDDDKEMFSIIDKMVEDDIFFDNGIKDVGITYVDTDSERCVKVFKLSQFSEPNQLIYKFPYNQTEFIEFLRVSSLKIVNNLSDRTYLRIFASPFKFQVHLFLKSDFFNRKNQEYMKAFQEAAMYNYEQQLYYERAVFVQSIFGQENREFHEQFDIKSESELPFIAVTSVDYDNFSLLKYIYPANQMVTNESIIQFLEDVRMKKVDPYYRSEKVDEQENEQNPIKKITGNTFRQMIYRSQKSALVLFWDSKNTDNYEFLYQLFENFTKEVKPELYESKLFLATYDLNLNENEQVNFNQAPIIVLYPQGGKNQYHRFNAEYNVGSLRNFVSYWVKDLDIKVKVHIKLEDEPKEGQETAAKDPQAPLYLGGPNEL